VFDDLHGKNALVTGASSGLGRHFARVLARHGASVTLAARRQDALEAACTEIMAAGGRANAIAVDVTDSGAVSSALAGTGESFDILINNAGIAASSPALDLDVVEWDRMVDTNLKGVFVVAQAVARAMRAAGRGGSIVNIASIAGLRVAGNLSAYAASKAAVIHLTRALALEWARYGIRVNALCPGYIETDLNREFFATEAGLGLIKRIPQRRLGKPHDLDGPLLLLASDAGSYMTGSTIEVDGGHLVSSL
jgi:NAD(P)-dependent dehydrogenase (short-subunit alcohol dehydrogenase family)